MQKAIELNSNISPSSNKKFLCNSYYNLGLLLNNLCLLEKSHTALDSCISIAGRYSEKIDIMIMALEEKSFSYHNTGDYEKCVTNAEAGLILARERGKKEDILALLLQIIQGKIPMQSQIQKGETKEVLDLARNKDISIECKALAYFTYAKYLVQNKSFNEAFPYYQLSYALREKSENWQECIRLLKSKGEVYYYDLHNYQKAIREYKKALAILAKHPDNYLESQILTLIGNVFLDLNENEKGLTYFQKALIALPIAFSETNLTKNPPLVELNSVTNQRIAFKVLESKSRACLNLYKKTQHQGYLKNSLDCLLKATYLIDQMRWKQYNDPSKLYWRQQTLKMFEQAIETCFFMKDMEHAFYFFEKSRAVMLSDKLNELGAQKFISTKDQAEEQRLRIGVVTAQERITSMHDSAAHFLEAKKNLLSIQDSLERFIKNLEKKYPLYYEYKYNDQSFSLADLRKDKQFNNTTTVEYFTTDSCVYALVIGPEKTFLKKLPVTNYAKQAGKLMQLCSDKSILNEHYGEYKELAQYFYKSLFEPLKIQTQHVIISQDDQFIPFDVLLKTGSENHFLLKDHAFRYTYSASCMMKNNHEPSNDGHSFLGIAPVKYREQFNLRDLISAGVSLNAIRRFFPDGKFLTNDQATKRHFVAGLQQYDIVQLYTHADAGDLKGEPKLYFQDTLMRMNEIQALKKVKSKLIVLSACETGIGKNFRGEGVFSLARGFASAGIPSTITSLWQIDSKSTYQITELFYKYLDEGYQTDISLQKAKLEFLEKEDMEKLLPYYWAANILVGRSDVFIGKTDTVFLFRYSLISWAAVLFVLLVAFYLYKIRKDVANTYQLDGKWVFSEKK